MEGVTTALLGISKSSAALEGGGISLVCNQLDRGTRDLELEW